MTRNMDDYGPDPDVFRPGRFLETGSKARDPSEYVFGFGRRYDSLSDAVLID